MTEELSNLDLSEVRKNCFDLLVSLSWTESAMGYSFEEICSKGLSLNVAFNPSLQAYDIEVSCSRNIIFTIPAITTEEEIAYVYLVNLEDILTKDLKIPIESLYE